jgi:hypothetical protein
MRTRPERVRTAFAVVDANKKEGQPFGWPVGLQQVRLEVETQRKLRDARWVDDAL